MRDPWSTPIRKTLLAAVLITVASACGSSSEHVVASATTDSTPTQEAASPEVEADAESEPAVVSVPAFGAEADVEPEPTDVPVPAFGAAAGVDPEPTDEAREISGPTAQSAPPSLAVQGPPAGLAPLPVPASIGVPAEFAEPPAGEPLCVVGIDAPDTLNVRSGPGVEYDIRGALRPDACILRAAGRAAGSWQPVRVIVAASELIVMEGWVSSNFVLPATSVATPEAAVVAADPSSILSVRDIGGDPLLTVPCEEAAEGVFSCATTGWFWQPAPSPCAQQPVSHWKLGTVGTAEARQASDGSWTISGGPGLVLDC